MPTFPLLIFCSALILSAYSIRKIIYIAHKKHLFDEPGENRKLHKRRIPNLAGVGIFASIAFTASIFLPFVHIPHLNYMIASSVILFALGLTDDLVGVNPTKKILAQVIVALMIIVLADIRFTGLHGILGIYAIPYALSVSLSSLFILLIINAFNLIDGINGLAGGMALLVCTTFALCFGKIQEPGLMYIALALCGSLLPFLYYNKTPARIFMGDTGSLFLGFVIALFTIRFIELNGAREQAMPAFETAPALMLALLIVPVFDTLRVFLLRLRKGRSPFSADRNHLHHRLIDLGYTHLQATGILLSFNLVCVLLVLSLPGWSNEGKMILVASLAFLANQVSASLCAARQNKTQPAPKVLQAAKEKAAPYELPSGLRIIKPVATGAELDDPVENILQ